MSKTESAWKIVLDYQVAMTRERDPEAKYGLTFLRNLAIEDGNAVQLLERIDRPTEGAKPESFRSPA